MDEVTIIRSFFPNGKTPEDDCFFLPPDRLVTTDSLAEFTHFRRDWSSPEDLAWKLVEVNVSDIISSGGVPDLAFLNFGVPKDKTFSKSWISKFQSGLARRLDFHKVKLAGGDTFLSPHLSLTLTLLGKIKTPWLRSGAKVQDSIYLSGSLGGSEAGLAFLKGNAKARSAWHKRMINKHLRPTSRFDLFPILKKLKISSCMDISDGLVQDSKKLALASKVSLQIEIEKIPFEEKVIELLGWEGVLTSGEELELLFTSRSKIPSGIPVTEIGKVVPYNAKEPVRFTLQGKIFNPSQVGFLHFK